jgi:hypothetical protein
MTLAATAAKANRSWNYHNKVSKISKPEKERNWEYSGISFKGNLK